LRHAVFIAFHYPPEASSSGVLRTLKYSRYLGEYGWRVTVIAPTADAYSIVDEQLTQQIPDTVRVIRTRWLNTRTHLSIRGIYPALLALPDSWIGWLPWGVSAARRLLREDPAQLVYSTSPHATSHLIGLRVVKATGLPWVTDFRDPWIEEPPEPGAPSGPIYTGINRMLERKVIERSSHIVASTTHLRDQLRSRYPSVPSARISAILNGYDEADFGETLAPESHTSRQFVIVHAGSINAEFRDPRPLLQALAQSVANGVVDREKLCIRFIGGGDFADSKAMSDALASTGLGSQVTFVKRVPYEESLRELGGADLLLLLQASHDTTGLVPAKLYEYLRSQKPVLALVHPGATSEVLATTGGGWAVDPREPETLRRTLEVAYAAWQNGTLAQQAADLQTLRQFDRRLLTGHLAQIFDRVIAAS